MRISVHLGAILSMTFHDRFSQDLDGNDMIGFKEVKEVCSFDPS